MRIMGIDPGTIRCGYGVVDLFAGAARPIDYGVVRPPRDTDLPQRLKIIYDGLCELIERHEPEVVAVEGAFYGANAKTAIKIGEARGIVLLAAQSADLKLVQYPPATVKKAVVGNGNASKEQVQQMIKVELGLSEIPEPNDAADGLALALCYCHRERYEDLI